MRSELYSFNCLDLGIFPKRFGDFDIFEMLQIISYTDFSIYWIVFQPGNESRSIGYVTYEALKRMIYFIKHRYGISGFLTMKWRGGKAFFLGYQD